MAIDTDVEVVDPLIAKLRTYNDFPIDYSEDVDYSKVVESINEQLKLEGPLLKGDFENRGTETSSIYSFSIQSQIINETTTQQWKYDATALNPVVINYSTAYRPEYNQSFSSGMQKSVLTPVIIYTPSYPYQYLFVATGFAMNVDKYEVKNFWLEGTLIQNDGVLTPSRRQWWAATNTMTLDKNQALLTIDNETVKLDSLGQPELKRVLVGYGIHCDAWQIMNVWGYTAPYDPVTKRIKVKDVNDIHKLMQKPDKAGDHPNHLIEMVVRTFDKYPTVDQFSRAFVTGTSAWISYNDTKRLGLRVTFIQ